MKNKLSFIERQFPVSRVSKESYKERKANNGQTLTGLGKWWGRKPLILVRATILGCLMPCSDNPKADMDIFLKILSMDNDGLLERKDKTIPAKELYEIASKSKHFRQYLNTWFEMDGAKVSIKAGEDRKDIETRLFKTLGYDEKLKYCKRPEQLENLCKDSWNTINRHLGTNAYSLNELISQLSIKRYGKLITVGDCFSGGGSIPFEAARMGANVYASDLNPVASLLTWASINILSVSDEEVAKIRNFQQEVFNKVDKEISKLGIEHNELGDRAVSYLYCVESKCPECGVRVPLAPSWVIGKGTKTIAILKPNVNLYDIEVKMGATPQEMKVAEKGTIVNNSLVCPSCNKITPISILRKDRTNTDRTIVYGLRQWEKHEFDFREDDIFAERLYAIKYQREDGKRYYRAPNNRDLENEFKIKRIVKENIKAWQEEGFIPSLTIETGYNTEQAIRERGWTHWHHLFNARQLLLLKKICDVIFETKVLQNKVVALLGLNKSVDWNSKLCRWNSGVGNEKSEQTFYNQAFNTLMNWGSRSLLGLQSTWFYDIKNLKFDHNAIFRVMDARNIKNICEFWITDPPYADAVNYHELSEFFLAWDKRLLQEAFPEWYADSKRVLAVRGDESFSQTMIDIYSNLTNHMPDDGMQVVMFTHSDPAVWAQLALIMWKSGLRVTAAWNIATETESGGLKDGNYVKGTVLLVLRKQTEDKVAFLDELDSDIRKEVKKQIESMQELENKEEPNFSDPDYVLAAYAASLKALTSYKDIEDLDLDYELNLAIKNPTQSAIVKIIEDAKKVAYEFIIPKGFENYQWKGLSNAEKFYIKGLESEKQGNYQISTYQEFAKGFNISGYGQMMANERANTARLKTPVEMANRRLADIPDFENSILRTLFMAIYTGVKEDESPMKALGYIKNELPDYWDKRDIIKLLLDFIKDTKDIDNMKAHWAKSGEMAELLYSLVSNDHI